ncbi:MAG: pyruvate dehydrogenase (acetyl-transferring), homodimeric type [Legionellales bacterium]|nr:pyruvate dehydrogenase (acetyl-transferring), homodimeric type [Legionellales bacterium]
MDEPETLSAISFASYEQLDNLIFVINCNLQRLDGLVRSHGQIVQELEARFKASGWRVIKVLFNSAWDPLFERDQQGILIEALSRCVDGQFQRFSQGGGAVWRAEFFDQSEALKALIQGWSDDDLDRLSWGGHDPQKVYAAYHSATAQQNHPTVILVQTTKGYGVPGAAGMNTAHNVKSLGAEDLQAYAAMHELPLSQAEAAQCTFIEPDLDAAPIQYLHARRRALGGALPARHATAQPLAIPKLSEFSTVLNGSGDRAISSTMAFVRILSQLLKTPDLKSHIVPISPDESRTFGMEGLFRQIGIYNTHGQAYTPVDRDQVMYYREAKDGQFLQEGINEAGAMASWIAAATAYSHSALPMVPFYIFYSMFGFQRVADLIWAAGDSRARGFLIGATSGRTTLAGEGLQHTDGHSHVMASTVPNCKSYDPTYGYELAIIIQHGLKKMMVDQEDIFYYLTVVNENIPHLPMPEQPHLEDHIIRGMYCLETYGEGTVQVNLLGSGAILPEVREAAQRLHNDEGWTVQVWSVTSFNELARSGRAYARTIRLDPANQAKVEKPFIQTCLPDENTPVIAATDYMAVYADQVRAWVPGPYHVLGTDGFGRSDSREAMRVFFEVNAGMVAYTACVAQYELGQLSAAQLQDAAARYEIDLNRLDPMTC